MSPDIREFPRVSVIMPAYNCAAYIRDAIESVFAQDYPDLELIVVDDGSTDGTAEVARSFGDRVLVLEQANAGPAAARNLGVSVSKGEFLAFLDADDLWLEDKTHRQIDYLQRHPEVGVVFGRLVLWHAGPEGMFGVLPAVSAEMQREGIVPDESGWIYPEMLLDSVIWIVSAVVRRSVWNALGGMDAGLRVGEDYDFFIRASRLVRIDELDRVVAIYRKHSRSTTQILRKTNFELFVLKRAMSRFGLEGPDGRKVPRPLLRKRIFTLCFGFGHQHFWKGDPALAFRAFLEAFGSARFHPKVLTYLALAAVRWALRRRSA